jgi:hypothetical protein
MQNQVRRIATDNTTSLGDFRRWPGCRLLLTCTWCRATETYDPERIIARLQERRTGGPATQLRGLPGKVTRDCPHCGKRRWLAEFGWPAGTDAREVRRLANQYRN